MNLAIRRSLKVRALVHLKTWAGLVVMKNSLKHGMILNIQNMNPCVSGEKVSIIASLILTSGITCLRLV